MSIERLTPKIILDIPTINTSYKTELDFNFDRIDALFETIDYITNTGTAKNLTISSSHSSYGLKVSNTSPDAPAFEANKIKANIIQNGAEIQLRPAGSLSGINFNIAVSTIIIDTAQTGGIKIDEAVEITGALTQQGLLTQNNDLKIATGKKLSIGIGSPANSIDIEGNIKFNNTLKANADIDIAPDDDSNPAEKMRFNYAPGVPNVMSLKYAGASAGLIAFDGNGVITSVRANSTNLIDIRTLTSGMDLKSGGQIKIVPSGLATDSLIFESPLANAIDQSLSATGGFRIISTNGDFTLKTSGNKDIILDVDDELRIKADTKLIIFPSEDVDATKELDIDYSVLGGIALTSVGTDIRLSAPSSKVVGFIVSGTQRSSISEFKFQTDVPFRLVNLAGDPSSPEKGWKYFNTTSNKEKVFNGTIWETITSA